MVNLYDIPVYYICFKQKPELEAAVRSAGFNNVTWFPAIDGRKLDPIDLRDWKIISIRSYNDLVTQREQHSGISSMGAIGCTLSHSNVWKTCISEQHPYVIIMEDDIAFEPISKENKARIESFLEKPNSIFVSTTISRKPIIEFILLHFYVISNGACKELLDDVFPIDVQTDHYISHIAQMGKVNVEGFPIFHQKRDKSSIQDTCVKCFMPTRNSTYVLWLAGILGTIVLLIVFLFKWIRCRSTCQKV